MINLVTLLLPAATTKGWGLSAITMAEDVLCDKAELALCWIGLSLNVRSSLSENAVFFLTLTQTHSVYRLIETLLGRFFFVSPSKGRPSRLFSTLAHCVGLQHVNLLSHCKEYQHFYIGTQ